MVAKLSLERLILKLFRILALASVLKHYLRRGVLLVVECVSAILILLLIMAELLILPKCLCMFMIYWT